MIPKTMVALLATVCSLFVANGANAQAYRSRTGTAHVAVGPLGGVSAGQTHTAVNAGPFGASATKTQTGTKVTPGGTTVQYGKSAGVSSGPLGASAGKSKGVKVTTPTGQSYTHTSKGGVAAGPGGIAAGGSSRTTVAGPYGTAGVRRSSGVVVR